MWETGKNLAVHLLPDQCRTVLVLGAGASAHLGFPLGPQLCSAIINYTSNPSTSSFKDLLAMGFPHQVICSFHEQIKKSFPNSIDEFLSDRPNFVDVGRAAIAQILIGCENEDQLHNRGDNWYGLLRNRFKTDIVANRYPPMIVTFNYDLSLDKFLNDFVASTFLGKSGENVKIFHVHGRLGYLDYEARNPQGRSYGKGASPSGILAASQGIRVPSELDMDHGRAMVVAQTAINTTADFLIDNRDDSLYHLWHPGA